MQDCRNSSVLAMELLQSCAKPAKWLLNKTNVALIMFMVLGSQVCLETLIQCFKDEVCILD